jgi:hypothetical protein
MKLEKITDSATGLSFMMNTGMTIKTKDDGIAFVQSQLGVLDPKLYEVKYQGITFEEYIPIDSSDPEWADSSSYISYDAVTMGKFIGANAKDLPNVAINAKKTDIPLYYGGIEHGWSLDELRKSQQMRMPLDTTGAAMKVRGFKEHQQKVAYDGDTTRGLTGLFNNANVPETVATGFVPATATGDEWVDMLNTQYESVYTNTANVHRPNIQLIPQSFWKYLMKPMGTGGITISILTYYLENSYAKSLGINLIVHPVFQLNGRGVNSTGRIMTYELNPENLGMKVPMPIRSIAPQMEGLMVTVPSEYKFGGVFFRYPLSAIYTDMPA